jgi:pSer/pThr/pTyr-binding forkhead associated (FHA) protein
MSGVVLLGLRILLAIALYAFLGWALFLLWRTLRQDAQGVASRQVIPLGLLVSTPDTEDFLLNFTQGDIAIGRDPDCECVLTHSTVSARHARLTFHHHQWWVDDLQSTNGTKLNDEPLQMPTVVASGDTIKCGQVSLTIILGNQIQANPGEST